MTILTSSAAEHVSSSDDGALTLECVAPALSDGAFAALPAVLPAVVPLHLAWLADTGHRCACGCRASSRSLSYSLDPVLRATGRGLRATCRLASTQFSWPGAAAAAAAASARLWTAARRRRTRLAQSTSR
jgi:hypothetical protein